MTKGTPSKGKHNKMIHTVCKRCGAHAFHMRKKTCASCGFGVTARIKTFTWRWKNPLGKGNRKK
ncbi:MAG: 50S ribosomal protein L37e [Candidatus Aenigmatarchaeota archaeon]